MQLFTRKGVRVHKHTSQSRLRSSVSTVASAQLRMLVVIASYGKKNLRYLHQVLDAYRVMPFDIDLVVVSESPKDLGPDVEVVVGLPTDNPWTLPFAHQPIMAKRVDTYDVFVYSEDDIGVTADHIHAFLDATSVLASDEIAGFMRYEVDPAGRRLLAEPWAHYHWKPDSVRRRNEITVAEFTNEHAGFYVLTQSQLRLAIASGGYLKGPRQGRYQWPETAATDPYTVCGFRKVMCISSIERFLVHHLPNPYVHQLHLSFEAFKEQIDTLFKIRDGHHPITTLAPVESAVWPGGGWGKGYYERPTAEILARVPASAKNILSVGSGWGDTEVALKERGASVSALPLDSVIGAVTERRGIRVIYGELHETLRAVADEPFDCVLLTNLLHLQRDPNRIVTELAQLVSPGGTLVLAGPNMDRLPWRVKRLLNLDEYGRLKDFARGGHTVVVPRTLRRVISQAGLRITSVDWLDHAVQRGWFRGRPLAFGRFTAREWVLQAQRPY